MLLPISCQCWFSLLLIQCQNNFSLQSLWCLYGNFRVFCTPDILLSSSQTVYHYCKLLVSVQKKYKNNNTEFKAS